MAGKGERNESLQRLDQRGGHLAGEFASDGPGGAVMLGHGCGLAGGAGFDVKVLGLGELLGQWFDALVQWLNAGGA